MSNGVKFGITAFVVFGVVALGYGMHKKQQEKAAAASLTGARSTGKGSADKNSAFSKNPDGSPDYTHKADGTPIMFT